MKKIIWAIAAVFSIQVAFQLAMTVQRSDAEYAAMQTPLRDPVNGYIEAGLDADDLEIPAILVYPAAASATRVPVRPEAEFASIPNFAPHRRETKDALPAALFAPVVITYNRSGALTDAADIRRRKPAPVEERIKPTDDRSTIAKIVTKPYDLLKAVASKLH